jgi:hypothetical protein
VRRFVEDERAVDDNVRSENAFDRVEQRLLRAEPVGPGKEQVQVVETAQDTFAGQARDGFEGVAVLSGLKRG